MSRYKIGTPDEIWKIDERERDATILQADALIDLITSLKNDLSHPEIKTEFLMAYDAITILHPIIKAFAKYRLTSVNTGVLIGASLVDDDIAETYMTKHTHNVLSTNMDGSVYTNSDSSSDSFRDFARVLRKMMRDDETPDASTDVNKELREKILRELENEQERHPD